MICLQCGVEFHIKKENCPVCGYNLRSEIRKGYLIGGTGAGFMLGLILAMFTAFFVGWFAVPLPFVGATIGYVIDRNAGKKWE